MERNIGVLEVKECEMRSKKIRVEEDMKEQIDDKMSEINVFKRKVEELKYMNFKNNLEWEMGGKQTEF